MKQLRPIKTAFRTSGHCILQSNFPRDILLACLPQVGLILSCGEKTALEIKRLQPAGKQAMAARDWLNGVQLSPEQLLITPPEASPA